MFRGSRIKGYGLVSCVDTTVGLKDKERKRALKTTDDKVLSKHVFYLPAVAQRTCGH
jgi:hypothetical protein